ncbi:VOC family protein [Jiangella asiatica]|uniref:VOC family protein n=1 Tax=Jiangella asiatica TaxID=2530372 RepID=A0A4R5CLI2_9ACTN|nr:VOC family protein [Jiangella asiatica]TDE00796.1 VOC family protein [Jiangella asiatica]
MAPRSSQVFNLTFDAADPARLARFWATALGYELEPPPDGFGSWEEALAAWNVPEDRWDSASAVIDPDGVLPRLFFQKVPEPKTAKNRVHLDVRAWRGDERAPAEHRELVDGKVAELVEAGATVVAPVDDLGSYWVVMLDPEGNEFCVT